MGRPPGSGKYRVWTGLRDQEDILEWTGPWDQGDIQYGVDRQQGSERDIWCGPVHGIREICSMVHGIRGFQDVLSGLLDPKMWSMGRSKGS